MTAGRVHQAASTGTELLFCLQVHVTEFTAGSQLRSLESAPKVAFSFLDYAPVVIHPRNDQDIYVEGEGPRRVWEFQRGKSCLLAYTFRAMRRSLCHVPLVLMLCGDMRQQALSGQARLYATSCLSLASFVPKRRGTEPDSSVRTWGYFSGSVDVFTYKNQPGGCLQLTISLSCHGPRHTHPYIETLISSSGRPQAPPEAWVAGCPSPPRPHVNLQHEEGDGGGGGKEAVDAAHPPAAEPRLSPSCERGAAGGPLVEPFRVWDSDVLRLGNYRGGGRRASAVGQEADPPPLYYFHGRNGRREEPATPVSPQTRLDLIVNGGDEEEWRGRVDQGGRSRSLVPWRDPGVAKIPLGRSHSSSPVRLTARGRRHERA